MCLSCFSFVIYMGYTSSSYVNTLTEILLFPLNLDICVKGVGKSIPYKFKSSSNSL